MSSVLGLLRKLLGIVGNFGTSIPYIGPILKIIPLITELIGFLGDLRKDWRSGWEDDEDFDVFIAQTQKTLWQIRHTKRISKKQAERLNKFKNFIDNVDIY